MNYSPLLPLLLVVVVPFQHAIAQDRTVAGRVVDSAGVPVADVSVATYWRANGPHTKPDGQPYDLGDPLQVREYWGRLGQMEPITSSLSQSDGSFTITVRDRDRALYAIDAKREWGCIIEIPEDPSSDDVLVLPLVRLVKVSAEFRSAEASKSFDWSHTYVRLRPHPQRPLTYDRLVSCGSFEGKVEFRLPPGNYELEAYAVSDMVADDTDLRVQPAPTFTIQETDTERVIDQLVLTTASPGRSVLERESKQQGRWHDYTEHYGEPAPPWHAIDGRGIDHRKNLEQLRGKWVLLEFWGLSCVPCLNRGIPEMMEFYSKNAAARSQFEVVGICINYDGKVDSMEKLDEALVPIVNHVWKGKKIDFPIVLDTTFTTWERYGIPGLGTVVLIDPDGKLVEGNAATLQAILDQAE